MKISDKELQKMIHEELQEAVRKGEITEEELKQLQEGPIKNWFKDVGTGIDAYKKARGDREVADLNAKVDATDLSKVKIGNVDGRDVYDTKRPGDPGFVAKSATTPKASAPSTSAPAASQTTAAPTAKSADAATDANKQATSPVADASVFPPNQAQSIKQIADYKNFEKAFNTLNTTITNNKNLDPKELEGIVFTVNTKGQIVPMPGHMSLAQQAVKNAISKKQAEEFNREQTSGEPQGLRESKNPSYQETYNKWQKLIKG